MKRFNFLFLFLISIFVLGNGPLEKRKKTIDKTYSVNNDAVLEVVNKYGNITLSSWNQNTVSIHVEITVEGKNSEDVERRLNEIDVDFSASNSKVTAITKLGKAKNWNRKSKIKINYTIKLPANNHVYLTNDYGNITLDDLKGRSNIDLDYGNIKIGSLHNDSNNIVLDYANSSSIGYVNAANIDCDYGNLTIEKANKINWDSDYTDLTIHDLEYLNYDMDYGSIKIGKVYSAIGDTDYVGQNFGTVEKMLDVDGDYSAITVKKLKAGFKAVAIDSDYGAINISVEPNAGYTLNSNVSYGSISYPDNFEVKQKISKNYSKSVVGTAGNGSGSIDLEAEYGAIKLKIAN